MMELLVAAVPAGRENARCAKGLHQFCDMETRKIKAKEAFMMHHVLFGDKLLLFKDNKRTPRSIGARSDPNRTQFSNKILSNDPNKGDCF